MEHRTYRADIDGLRAVAVLAVLLYHAGVQPFTGGYIGVDVFFVISGYLITGLIVKDIRADRFSLVTFYERRIRRIFPAYFGMAVVVGLLAAWLYDATSLQAFGKSLVAATLSLANIFFYSQAGYFDSPSLLKPLLHTWSLAVEEQFYLFLPLLLFLIFKYARKYVVPILGAVLLLSLAGSIYSMQANPGGAFYLAHLRAWELLIGGLIALRPLRIKPWLHQVLSLLGLVVVLLSAMLYSENTAFPGLAALLPVLGTAAIINAGVSQRTWVGSLLSTRPMVLIGKISYSLYLWHWPLLVFAKYYAITGLTALNSLLWWLASFGFAILSWKFIETPFRQARFMRRRRIFLGSAAVAGVILAGALTMVLSGGLPQRYDFARWKNKAALNLQEQRWIDCLAYQTGNEGGLAEAQVCKLGDAAQPPSFVLWGDSHAMALAGAMDAAARESGSSGQLFIRNMCAPLIGVSREERSAECIQHNNEVISYIQSQPQIETVFLSARWALSVEGTRYKNEEGARVVLMDTLAEANGLPNSAIFQTGLGRTLEQLLALNKQVILLSAVPEVGYDVPSASFIAAQTGREINAIIAPSRAEFLQRNQAVFTLLQAAAEKSPGVQLLDLTDYFCDATTCRVVAGEEVLYKDDHHLSASGALRVEPVLSNILKNRLALR